MSQLFTIKYVRIIKTQNAIDDRTSATTRDFLSTLSAFVSFLIQTNVNMSAS